MMRARALFHWSVRSLCSVASLVVLGGTAFAQALPPPPGPLDFAYYKVIDKDDDSGTSLGETSCYTNTFRTGKDDFDSAPNWPEKVEFALFSAVAAGKSIILSLDLKKTGQHPADSDRGNIERAFDVARPVWDAVRSIDLADEPEWEGGSGSVMINERIDLVNEVLVAKGLPRPPLGIGATYAHDAVEAGENRITNSRLDWVAMEAYLNGDTGNPAANTANVQQRLIGIRDRTGNKPVIVVMQAYDYFGPWNMANLADVQKQTYRFSVEKLGARLVAITMFAYNRLNGTRSQPLLIAAHKEVASAIGVNDCGGGGHVPAAPINLAATAQLFTVTLNWTDMSGNETGFRIERLDPGGGWHQVGTVGANVTTFSSTVPAVPPGGSATYSYRVRAFNGIGDSAAAETSLTLYAERPPVPAQIGPQGCITSVNPTLGWSPAPRASSYYVAATRADVENFFINDPNVVATSYPVTPILNIQVTYRWKVKACNNMGCSGFSEMHFTPFCNGAASSITSPLGCIATSTPTFSWLPVTGAYAYWLVVGSSPDFSSNPLIVDLGGLNVTSVATPPGVSFAPGTTYYAKVKTILNPGSTTVAAWSPTVSFTPFCPPGVNQAAFVSQTVPASMTAGRSYPVSVTMRNTGTSVWTAADAYRLGSQNPQDNVLWGLGRVELAAVAGPGATAEFRFDVRPPTTPGTHNFQWRMVRDGVEWFGPQTTNVPVTVAAPLAAAWKADYDGDGSTDLSVWRPTDGNWFIVNSSTGVGTNRSWGINLDVIVPGDYDGDRKADVAVWRPAEGNWYITNSGNGSMGVQQWGGVAGDVPVPADYDGDGRTDIAVWRRFVGAGSSSAWRIVGSRDGTVSTFAWGLPTDIPVPGDYDGDGRADISVWRPSSGQWFIVSSSTGGMTVLPWGAAGDIPVPGDYDGDGRIDLAVWRQGTWLVVNSQNGVSQSTPWGAAGDVPVPGDYDGDRKTDRAVWRVVANRDPTQSQGTWYVLRSSTMAGSATALGVTHDVPTPKAR